MKLFFRIFSLLPPLLITIFTASCDDDKEISIPIDSSDIIIDYPLIDCSTSWITEGQILRVNIQDLDYSAPSPDIRPVSIVVEKDGNNILTVPYKSNTSLDIKVEGWSHGENIIKILVLFISDNNNIAKDLISFKIIVFNELPVYNIEGTATFQFITESYEYGETTTEIDPYRVFSGDHTFSYYIVSHTTTHPLTGTVTHTFTQISDPDLDFYIDNNLTNFDAKITRKELHWRTQDGPASLPKGEILAKEEILYATFTVSGEHEGISISQDTTYIFRFINGRNNE